MKDFNDELDEEIAMLHDLVEKIERYSKIEGIQSILAQQLEQKFGPLDTLTHVRLQQASIKELQSIASRVLFAKRLEELFSVETA